MSGYVTRTIRLASEEAAVIQRISAAERIPEGILLKKIVLDSIARYRRQQAVQSYRRGELDLSRAARYADISVYEMMDELHWQGIPPNRSVDKFMEGLEGFAEDFGDEGELRRAVARLRERSDLIFGADKSEERR